jgi:DNA (cytosine-5)-methyltransferase 1
MNAEQGQGWVCQANGNSMSNDTTPTLVGDHQDRVTDYTAICIGNGQLHDALSPSCEVSKTLNCMDDPMKIIYGKSLDGGQISPTLTANNAGGGQRMPDKDNFNAVIAYGLDRASYNQGANAKFDFCIEQEMIGPQISRGPGAVCARDYKGVGNEYVAEDKCIVEPYQQKVGSLCARDYKGVGNEYVAEDKCIVEPYQQKVGSLCARDYKGVGNVVRRLTPLEAERLQGYPDGWTDIGDWVDSKGKKHKGDSDSPRYKALGNSIALPSWYHLLKEISNTYEDGYTPTLGSLFDGIGGFPLCWELINGKGSARWASEIEEFPIAVTKKRFPEIPQTD